ncbi:MAG: hypothetical protein CVV06_13000 [Gammaproteobacteria bacterium HGW-Gammaproteobacteria-10]|nr:MAG: hypothetical protein CVV06_13000 [Gammaproteobacteria bacterium HGW-Gammaproteobacteria-10]
MLFLGLLPPYYYSACRDEGLSRFFVDSLSGETLPAMLYHFPQHTGNHLGIDMVTKLLDQGLSIVGIKDSSGDIDNARLYQSNFPELAVFLGNDEKVFEALQKGLSGSVTGAANPMPELLIAMQVEYRLSASKAQSMQRCLDIWNRFRNDSGYFEIPLVKAAMGARIDRFPVHVRPPLTPVPVEELDRVRKVICNCLNDFRLLN